MTLPNPDDTDLDAIAAQVRSIAHLDDAGLQELLDVAFGASADAQRARTRVVEQLLSLALDAAMAHADQGVDVPDLYQEATLAIVIAVDEYAGHHDKALGLRHYAEQVVNTHLKHAIDEARAAREQDEALVRAAEKLERAEVSLRHELGRQPTVLELASVLEWEESQVEIVQTALHAAHRQWDEEIVEYLDDSDDEAPAG